MIQSDELQTLLQIVSDLTLARDGAQYLEGVIGKVTLLLPVESCVVLHENSQGLCTSIVLRGLGRQDSIKSERRLWRGDHSWIDNYLGHFETLEESQHAFFWQAAGARQVFTPELAEFLKHIRLSQGVAGVIGSTNHQHESRKTLIQLQYEDEGFRPQHLLYVNFMMFHLHAYFVRCTENFVEPQPTSQVPQALTSREREVLQWVVQGKTSWEVGVILSMTERTVKFHLHNIYAKFNVANRAQAVQMASRLGLV